MANYDVFISCKSEDYKYAEEIYTYLMEEGVNTFLASKELRKMGESEYRKAISSALKEAYHMIVFASEAEYVESTWVEYEWDMFVNAKLKGKKQGNIVTILKGVDTDDLPMDLWKYESFSYDQYKGNILRYVETESSKERKKELLRKREEERLLREQQLKKEAKLRELKFQLEQSAELYKKAVSSLQVDIDKIYGILHELNISERTCPICSQRLPLEEESCCNCGWPISALDGIEELAYLNKDNLEIQEVYKLHYNKKLDDRDIEYKEELDILKGKLDIFYQENARLEKELEEARRELDKAKQAKFESPRTCNYRQVSFKPETYALCASLFSKLYLIISEIYAYNLNNYGRTSQETLYVQTEEKREEQDKTVNLNNYRETTYSSESKDSFSMEKEEEETVENKDWNFSLWVTQCPPNLIDFIHNFNPTFNKTVWAKMQTDNIKILVASFPFIKDALSVKTKLERKGALVEVWKQTKQLDNWDLEMIKTEESAKKR